jgi:hypothetical protein
MKTLIKWAMIALTLTALFFLGANTVDEMAHPCQESKPTGRSTCTIIGVTAICEPETVCVRR